MTEDYERLYGQYYPWHLESIGGNAHRLAEDAAPVSIDYKDKVVLDIGADWGSTAEFFLKKGAKSVIAVESDDERFNRLQQLAKDNQAILPVNLRINNVFSYYNLITSHQPDIIKIDCEGCEKHLVGLSQHVLRIPSLYIIEYHDVYDTTLKQYLIHKGFHIVGCLKWANTMDKQVFEKTHIEVIICERMG
jgi:hypothetical protein